MALPGQKDIPALPESAGEVGGCRRRRQVKHFYIPFDSPAHHGYGFENGTTFVCLMNREDIKEVRKFRSGVENNNEAVAAYDFIEPSCMGDLEQVIRDELEKLEP